MDFAQAQLECICRMCPTYIDCGEKLAFCMPATSKSLCIKLENGCLCPGCPVQDAQNFKHEYYCTKGDDKSQI
jgi:hypothetical protein